jgi:SOS-response transcriptional repressor LexA
MNTVAMNAPARAGLTDRMQQCFNEIERHISRNRCAPTYTQLGNALGLKSKSGVYRLLHELRERGWITFMNRKPQSIAVVRDLSTASYTLPPAVEAKLRAHCLAVNEDPAAVVADAVALFFDEAEGSVAA